MNQVKLDRNGSYEKIANIPIQQVSECLFRSEINLAIDYDHYFLEYIKSCIAAYTFVFGSPLSSAKKQMTNEDYKQIAQMIFDNLDKTAESIKLHQEFRKRFNIQTRSFDDIKTEHLLLSKKQKL
ncbi:hypothetical protein [Streptococcus suis]|uniref:hypothetical protein n=1 Tax=Streptococcus suis TaxID=1307 RepID=UPI00240F98E0|nr:hypothetical protein [Streptococcus suis]MDG3136288.1 hypothetical protein [Streptococcus suis]